VELVLAYGFACPKFAQEEFNVILADRIAVCRKWFNRIKETLTRSEFFTDRVLDKGR
jgi:hypothetical protein